MTTIGGLPAHPLIIHAVVVLLPLATAGSVLLLRPAWRQRFGVLVLLVALAGVAAVPAAVLTGGQLRDKIGASGRLAQAIAVHEQRGEILLPYAIVFGVLMLATVLGGWWADRDEARLAWRRATVAVAVLTAIAGVVISGLVIWIGHSGATSVWLGTPT